MTDLKLGTYFLGKRSRSRLEGVHPDLVSVVRLAIRITDVDFTVLEGLRTEERQQRLVAAGASKTLNSRHLTGHAVDLGVWMGGEVSWHWPHYNRLAVAMFEAANALAVNVEWGGNWPTLRDGPHWQLPRDLYS